MPRHRTSPSLACRGQALCSPHQGGSCRPPVSKHSWYRGHTRPLNGIACGRQKRHRPACGRAAACLSPRTTRGSRTGFVRGRSGGRNRRLRKMRGWRKWAHENPPLFPEMSGWRGMLAESGGRSVLRGPKRLEPAQRAGPGDGGHGADRDRTDNLLDATEALSQLSYGPLWVGMTSPTSRETGKCIDLMAGRLEGAGVASLNLLDAAPRPSPVRQPHAPKAPRRRPRSDA